MSLVIPLAVRLSTSRQDTHITRDLRDLIFRSAIPGGFASASFSLDRPLNLQPDEIASYARVYVYDTRDTAVLWEGRLEDSGRSAGPDGQIWQITAVGPAAHVRDRTLPLIYVDQSLERWHKSGYSTHGFQLNTGEIDADTPYLRIEVPQGGSIPTTGVGDWIYRTIWYCGQKLARVRADWDTGRTNADWDVTIHARAGTGVSPGAADVSTWNVAGGILAAMLGGTNLTVAQAHDVVSLRVNRNTSTEVAPVDTWATFAGVSVRAELKNADGTDITTGYTVNNVDPVEVVADLLGRVLTQYDGANANLIGSGVDIDQLAYPDGVTPEQILEDLAVYDPAFYWAAWESNSAGKYRFEYVPWPTAVRYEADIADGFDSPASAGELFNAVRVRWRDPRGRVRNTQRTQTVQALTDAGLTREAYIDISDDMGSSANAQRVGDNFLLEHRYPPNAGTLRIARPVLDLIQGRMVQPWELRPGALIRVRGVLPWIDSLNLSDRDGVTVFRVISVEFSAADGAVTLELDSYSRTVARALAKLRARRFRKR